MKQAEAFDVPGYRWWVIDKVIMLSRIRQARYVYDT